MKPFKKLTVAIAIIFLGLVALPVYATPITSEAAVLETEPPVIHVQDIDLGDYQSEMHVGKTQLLMITVLPTNTTNQNVAFKSSKTNIATINMMGRITAVAIGETNISVTAGGITRDFILKVTAESTVTEPSEPHIAVTNIEISNFKDTIKIDKTVDLTATVLPKDATKQEVKYSSNNLSVVTVSSSGQIKGISAGNATITIEADGFKKSISLSVKVATQNIEINTTYIVLNKSEEFYLAAKALPSNADQTITYKSTSPEVASVSADGLVKAVKTGSASIMVSTWDTSKIVSVIVHEGSSKDGSPNDGDSQQVFNPNESDENKLAEMISELPKDGQISVDGSTYSTIPPTVLKELYGTGKSLIIQYSDYTVTILGENVKNVENGLNTKIFFTQVDKGLEFTISNGKNLPGKIQIQLLNKNEYSHLYLYNETKGGYQEIKALESNHKFSVDSNGKYILTHDKISTDSINWIIIAGITMIGIALAIAYIAVKKRHWFW
jgi:uncharacterized protein YjdB